MEYMQFSVDIIQLLQLLAYTIIQEVSKNIVYDIWIYRLCMGSIQLGNMITRSSLIIGLEFAKHNLQ